MQPLSERMRPKSLSELVGQEHLVSEGMVLNIAIKHNHLPSMIFWGPPGVGKTTIALLLAKTLGRPFFSLSAVNAGVKEVREAILKAQSSTFFNNKPPILFIDEIHRFNKGQQDALLSAVETGIITLLGATTENPSFELNNALLSRCQVYILKPLNDANLLQLAANIFSQDDFFKNKKIELLETESLLSYSAGDGRKLCNILELLASHSADDIKITNELINTLIHQNLSKFDKQGELHYDIASALIKSIRGSDPNAALYYLARMIQGGEEPRFISRRLIISAAEDIGLANPNALLIAEAAARAADFIGFPESRIILSEAVIYLACSPKSNSAYTAIEEAIAAVIQYGDLSIPLHLRNAPTALMKKNDYGKGYKYAHEYKGNFIDQEYLPEEISGTAFYKPSDNSNELKHKENLNTKWKSKYQY